MKAFILCAGMSTRLRPITDNIPKVMVEIDGKPLLEYHINWLVKNDIRDIAINLHYLPEVIKKYFGDGSKFGANLHYSFEPEILGTSGGFKKIEEFINKEQCIVIYGDNFFELDLDDFKKFHEKKGGMVSMCVKEWPDPTSKGIVDTRKDGSVISFKEKPKPEEVTSNIGNAGIYLVEPKIFDFIKPGVFSDFGKNIFPEMLSREEKIFVYKLNGYHEDVGTLDMLEKVRRDVENKNV